MQQEHQRGTRTRYDANGREWIGEMHWSTVLKAAKLLDSIDENGSWEVEAISGKRGVTQTWKAKSLADLDLDHPERKPHRFIATWKGENGEERAKIAQYDDEREARISVNSATAELASARCQWLREEMKGKGERKKEEEEVEAVIAMEPQEISMEKARKLTKAILGIAPEITKGKSVEVEWSEEENGIKFKHWQSVENEEQASRIGEGDTGQAWIEKIGMTSSSFDVEISIRTKEDKSEEYPGGYLQVCDKKEEATRKVRLLHKYIVEALK